MGGSGKPVSGSRCKEALGIFPSRRSPREAEGQGVQLHIRLPKLQILPGPVMRSELTTATLKIRSKGKQFPLTKDHVSLWPHLRCPHSLGLPCLLDAAAYSSQRLRCGSTLARLWCGSDAQRLCLLPAPLDVSEHRGAWWGQSCWMQLRNAGELNGPHLGQQDWRWVNFLSILPFDGQS